MTNNSSLLLSLAAVFFSFSCIVASKTIEVLYPKKLSSMYLRGNDCDLNWDKGVAMSPEAFADGYKWKYTLNCSGKNISSLEVKVLINDNQWMLGSNHHVTFKSDEADIIYPWFSTYVGTQVIIKGVYSSELNNKRDIIVYLPPSYYENTLKVHKNVMIMHDGQNLFNPATTAFGTAWMCQDTMNDMIIGGKSDEVILVGAYNTPDRNTEYTYIYDPSEGFGGKGDLYLDWIESTLIPLVSKTYRVDIQRETLGILGSSLGGLISCYAGWTRSAVYGRVGCMSTSLWWDDQDFQKHVLPNNTPSTPLPLIYMDAGTSGSMGGEAQCAVYTGQVYDYYLAHGFTANVNAFNYVDQGGKHDEASWGRRFYMPIQSLYPPGTV